MLINNREWLTTSTSSALGLLLNVDVGLEVVKFKAYQASFIVSQSKHNVEVVILGDNRESLTTTTSSALGLMFNIDVGQEDAKFKAFQAAFIASLSMHHVQVVTSVGTAAGGHYHPAAQRGVFRHRPPFPGSQ